MINDPAIIVAGASQSGTTSLYELLSQVRGISASNIKELDFWHRPELADMTQAEIESVYISQFPISHPGSIMFEASPAYLRHSDVVVGMIKKYLANAKIIIILRNPNDRLYAVYRKMKVEDVFVHNLEFSDFLDIAKTGLWKGQATAVTKEIRSRADVGNYLKYLKPYLREFTPEHLAIINFHQLISNPDVVLIKLEKFIGLPQGALSDVGLPWTNKNDAVKSFWLHHFSKSLYMRFEPFFRRRLRVKRFLRNAYQLLNTKNRQEATRTQKHEVDYPYQFSFDYMLDSLRSHLL